MLIDDKVLYLLGNLTVGEFSMTDDNVMSNYFIAIFGIFKFGSDFIIKPSFPRLLLKA